MTTHDPLCPYGDPRVIAAVAQAMHDIGEEPTSTKCPWGTCELIARVRSDERDRAAVILEDLSVTQYMHGQRDERKRVLREVRAVVRDTSPEWKEALTVVMTMVLGTKVGDGDD